MREEVEEKPKAKEVKICITIPTKESIVEKLKELFPSVKVEEEEIPKETE